MSFKGVILQYLLKDDGIFPNNPMLPVLIYKNILRENVDAQTIENVFKKNN